jgi:hypothetical protein
LINGFFISGTWLFQKPVSHATTRQWTQSTNMLNGTKLGRGNEGACAR